MSQKRPNLLSVVTHIISEFCILSLYSSWTLLWVLWVGALSSWNAHVVRHTHDGQHLLFQQHHLIITSSTLTPRSSMNNSEHPSFETAIHGQHRRLEEIGLAMKLPCHVLFTGLSSSWRIHSAIHTTISPSVLMWKIYHASALILWYFFPFCYILAKSVK